jgi:hypothetical protein
MISTLRKITPQVRFGLYGQITRDRRASVCSLASLLLVTFSHCHVFGQEDAARLTSASRMLPADTQALFSLTDSERFLAKWSKTKLGQLAADKLLKPFWDTQRKEIQGRFEEAGWQLSLEIDDLSDVSGGQTAIAWIARPKVTTKPYSIAMIIDVAGRIAPAENLLKRIEQQLKAKNATTKTMDISGANVVQYTLPKVASDLRVKESFYALHKDQLLAADDITTITELLSAQSGTKADSLANSDLYKSIQTKIVSEGEPAEVEYFVRPIGFAKLLRSIGSRPSNSQADILKILEKEGFDSIQCVAGNIQIQEESFDFFHHGFVMLKKPLSESVKVLDFPNVKSLAPPDFINKDSASVLSFSWDIKNAFPRFKGIVDSYVGPDTFNTVIEGIRDDPMGPQIDIIREVLPFLTTQFHVVTEIKQPITPESKRSMVLLQLADPNKKLLGVLNRFGKAEPNAKPEDVEGVRVWRIKNDTEVELTNDFNNDAKSSNKNDDEEHLLDQWAVAILDDYFIFASDADLIVDTIRAAKSGKQTGLFAKEADVELVSQMLSAVVGNEGFSFRDVTRSDRAFEMQYELFRQDKLPESKSMLASILDKLLKPKNSTGPQQKVKGDKLPPYKEVQSFFTPSGGVVQSEEDGWSVQSFILNK